MCHTPVETVALPDLARPRAMPQELVSLDLTTFWKKEPVLLVRTIDAIRLCHDGGYQRLSRQATLACLTGAEHVGRAWLCDFVLRAQPASSPLVKLEEGRMLALLSRLVESNELVAVREGDKIAKGEERSLIQQRELVRAIGKQTRQALAFEGRRYRLTADADLGKVPSRDQYEVVGRSEALRILAGLAKQANPSLAALLEEAGLRLTRDWRPPLRPDGLILLRGVIARVAPRPSGERAPRQPSAPGREEATPQAAAPEPEVIGGDVDQASQAATLLEAAVSGVPFCEECARAATSS